MANCTDAECATQVPADLLGETTDFANYSSASGKCTAVCETPHGFSLPQDQPYCVPEIIVRGTLGGCTKDANATSVLSTLESRGGATMSAETASLFEGSANQWQADARCESVSVTSCAPMPEPPGLCGRFDVFAGQKATTIVVPRTEERRRALNKGGSFEWLIFETGLSGRDALWPIAAARAFMPEVRV